MSAAVFLSRYAFTVRGVTEASLDYVVLAILCAVEMARAWTVNSWDSTIRVIASVSDFSAEGSFGLNTAPMPPEKLILAPMSDSIVTRPRRPRARRRG
jgi:hypothetical protein